MECASEQQKAYARELGITFNDSISADEISALISVEKLRRRADRVGLRLPVGVDLGELEHMVAKAESAADPVAELVARFGFERGFDPGVLLTRKQYYDQLCYWLSKHDVPGLVIWFVWRVQRDRALRFGGENVPLGDARIMAVAESLLNDQRIVKSIMRYDGRGMRFFGSFTGDGGYVVEGGSRSTIAYKAALAGLSDAGVCVAAPVVPKPSGDRSSRSGVRESVVPVGGGSSLGGGNAEGIDIPKGLVFMIIFIIAVVFIVLSN